MVRYKLSFAEIEQVSHQKVKYLANGRLVTFTSIMNKTRCSFYLEEHVHNHCKIKAFLTFDCEGRQYFNSIFHPGPPCHGEGRRHGLQGDCLRVQVGLPIVPFYQQALKDC